MVAVGDIFRFTVRSTVAGQACFNVDFKEMEILPTNPLTMFELARSYHAEWATRIMPSLSGGAQLNSVLVENLTDGISFGEYIANVSGSDPSGILPSFTAIGVRLNRATKITRNGYKRIAGVGENVVTANALALSPANKTLVEGMFANTVIFDDLANPPDTFQMGTVIVGRTLNMAGVYELDLTKINPVVTAVVQADVTTQNSRKPE